MLSAGDVVQPGALGSSYGIGPYTVVPSGAGAPMGGAVSALGTPGAATGASGAQPAIAGAGAGMPGASGAMPGSIPGALQSSLPSPVPGATPSPALGATPSSATGAMPSDAASTMGALPGAPAGSASASTGFPTESSGLPAGTATDGTDPMSAPTGAGSGLSGQLPLSSSPTQLSASDAPAAFDPSSIVGGQTTAVPTGPANALAPSGMPIGQSPDSFDVVMKILKGQ